MKHSAYLAPLFNIENYAFESGIELAYATAALHYFDLLERERDMRRAIREIGLSEALSEYAVDMATYASDLLLIVTQKHNELLMNQFQETLKLFGYKVLKKHEWDEKTERIMGGNYGTQWERCKEWILSGDDANSVIYQKEVV